MWAVCGGFFITNFILSNFVAIMLTPVFEEPVETANVTLQNHSTQLLSSIEILILGYLQEKYFYF